MYYAWAVDAEVGGLGYIQFDQKENDIFVKELYLLDQEVHASECTLDKKSIQVLSQELLAANEKEKFSNMNFWWHSHKDMGAFFSGTDDSTMRDWDGKYLVALVINRKGELKARLMSRIEVGLPFPQSDLLIKDIDVRIDWCSIANADDLQEAIDTKVRRWTPPVQNQQVVVPGQQQFPYQGGYPYHGGNYPRHAGMQPTPRFNYHDPYNWDEDDEEWTKWGGNNSPKKIHSMTREEWEKSQEIVEAQDLIEAEAQAWADGDVETIIQLNDMDADEAASLRAMFGVAHA